MDRKVRVASSIPKVRIPITGTLKVLTTHKIIIYERKNPGIEIRAYAVKVVVLSYTDPLRMAAWIPVGNERLHIISVAQISRGREFRNRCQIFGRTG